MKRALLICAVTLTSLQSNAQVTAPSPNDSGKTETPVRASIVFNVTACQTEYIGPMQMKSGNWELVDSVIETLGTENALVYFKQHLHDNKSASFYALIGIHKIGASGEFEQALMSVENEEILFQKGCLMMKKPLREAVNIALRDKH